MPGWPNGPAAHLVWARGGVERKEGQDLRLMELEGALENPGAPHYREKAREGRRCPRPHSAEEANTPTLYSQDIFLGCRPALDLLARAQV